MPGLDEIRLQAARLEAELLHFPRATFSAIHAIASAKLASLKRAEEREFAIAQSQLPKAPHPDEVERKRRDAIIRIKSGIPPLQGALAQIPLWDWQRRGSIEAAIANYESQVEALEAKASV